MNIIYADTPYNDDGALAQAQSVTLKNRRLELRDNFYKQIEYLQHKWHKLLLNARVAAYDMRCTNRYPLQERKPTGQRTVILAVIAASSGVLRNLEQTQERRTTL